MVRRRVRTAKEALTTTTTGATSNCSSHGVGVVQQTLIMNGNNDAVAAAIASATLLEDQYCASPKRKDCKLANANENLTANIVLTAAVAIERRHKNSYYNYDHSSRGSKNNKNNQTNNAAAAAASGGASEGNGRTERGGNSGRNIGIPLATRAQTRTIKNFFKANAAAKNANSMTFNNQITRDDDDEEQKTISSYASTSASSSPQLSPTQQIMIENISPTPESVESTNNDYEDDDDFLPIYCMHDDDHEPTPSPPRFVLNGEDSTNDTIYSVPESINHNQETTVTATTSNDFATLADFQTHRSPSNSLRDSHSSHSSSSTSDNIFLQEPVLKLNIDKSPNQASSIKINKSFEAGAVFSSPPGSGSSMLNGRFNQIVTLNGGNSSPTKRESFGYESRPFIPIDPNNRLAPLNGFVAVDQESSSCDSGVAFSANSLTPNGGIMNNNNQTAEASPSIQTTRRRKPATPHRILCPSPNKTVPQSQHHDLMGLVPGARKVAVALKEPLSSRKSQRQLMNGGSSNKTRRRLNNKEVLAPYYPKTIVGEGAEHKIQIGLNNNIDDEDYDDDDSEHAINGDEENENVTNMPQPENCDGGGDTNVIILNSATHPTARQNMTNNSINQMTANAATNTSTTTTAPNAITMRPITKQTQKKKRNGAGGTKPKTASNGNRELTDFFPVRRSVRKTKTVVKEEMMRSLEQAVLEERAEGLKIAHFEKKGRGVIADRRFQRNEFVIEYVGDLISVQEAAEREKNYALDENAGCYMYYFKHKNQQYCIDATADTGKFGRLVNHSRNGNLVTKILVVKQRPHLVLLAKDDIEKGEELTYDYGDRSKESLLHHPWLAF